MAGFTKIKTTKGPRFPEWSGNIEQPTDVGSSMGQVGDPRLYNTDKLGIGAMYNERRADQAYDAMNRELARRNGSLVSFSNLGPLPDYRWRAFTGALSRNADNVGMENPNGLPESRFNEMTPFYNDQFGGDVSNHYETQGLMPQQGASLAGGANAEAEKMARAAMKRQVKGRRR